MVVFKDSFARVGKPKKLSEKTTISATSPSRSLSSHTPKSERLIKIEILDNGYLILDFNSVIGTKAKVPKTYALKLAKWIISVYDIRTQIKKGKK